jgi:rhodanese-related sulfurtransferase
MISIIKLFILIGSITLFISCSSTPEGVTEIDEKTFKKLEVEQQTLVIDVRSPNEVNNGYIKGADMFIDYNGEDFESEVEKLDRSKKYIVYCASGKRSAKASKVFIDKGFKEVYNLTGGIGAWSGEIVH